MAFCYFTMNQIKLQSFVMVPDALFEVESLKILSGDAKLLYGILLRRTNLSIENNWRDENGRVYVIYTIKQIQDKMNCANKKAGKILHELEKVGLIEISPQGGQKANIIYVKNYIPDLQDPESHPDKLSTEIAQTCPNNTSTSAVTCQNDISRHVETTPLDVSKRHTSYKEINYTEKSYNPSFLPFSSTDDSTGRMSCQIRVDEVIEELDEQEAIPYYFKAKPEYMRIALDYLCSYEDTHQNGIPYAKFWNMTQDEALEIYDLAVDSLDSMMTADGLQTFRGAYINYSKVIDAVNKNINAGRFDLKGGLLNFLQLVIPAFYNATITRQIKNVSKYMQSMLWDYLVSGKVKDQADTNYCLHRDGYLSVCN